jgi:hypothetical protein
MLEFMLRRGKWTENAFVFVLPGRTGAFHHQLSSRPGFAAAVAQVASYMHAIPKHVLYCVFSYLTCSDSGLAFFQISYKFSVYYVVLNKLLPNLQSGGSRFSAVRKYLFGVFTALHRSSRP